MQIGRFSLSPSAFLGAFLGDRERVPDPRERVQVAPPLVTPLCRRCGGGYSRSPEPKEEPMRCLFAAAVCAVLISGCQSEPCPPCPTLEELQEAAAEEGPEVEKASGFNKKLLQKKPAGKLPLT